MPDMDGIVAGLKGKMGLPSVNDVNPGGGSSPQPNAQPNLPSNPAQQVAQAQDVLNSIQNPTAPEPTEADKAMAAKDQAITDLKAQIDGMQQGYQAQGEKIQELLNTLTQKDGQQQAAPEAQLPGLPENFGEQPADQQLQILVDAFTGLRDAVSKELKGQTDNLKSLLGPMAKEVSEVATMKDKQVVAQMYPNYDWDANKAEYDKLRYEVPRLTAAEAAAIIAARKDPKQLMPAEPTAPASEPSIPSPQAAAGNPGLQNPHADDSANVSRQLISAIQNAHSRNQSAQAGTLMDALLKQKLMGKGPR